jgi:hypothetical protein
MTRVISYLKALWSAIRRVEIANMPTLELLRVARAMIADKSNWVQRRYETREGRMCAVGALRAAARKLNLQDSGAHMALLAVAQSRGFADIESMNDNSSHRTIITAFDEAIAAARRAALGPEHERDIQILEAAVEAKDDIIRNQRRDIIAMSATIDALREQLNEGMVRAPSAAALLAVGNGASTSA